MTAPRLLVLAGPNGAGKTTFARYNLQYFIQAGTFLNADDIAQETRPNDVGAIAIQAGREVLVSRRRLLARGETFCIETTLATRTLLNFVRIANASGYVSRLLFLFTPDPRLNEMRVKLRVMMGGHNIDTDTIRRRHTRGLQLLPEYWNACAEVIIFDARSREPLEIARREAATTRVAGEAGWTLLQDRVAAAGGRVLS